MTHVVRLGLGPEVSPCASVSGYSMASLLATGLLPVILPTAIVLPLYFIEQFYRFVDRYAIQPKAILL